MINLILDILRIIFIILFMTIILIIIFLFKGEVQSIVPKKIKKKYNFKTKKANKRRVFVLTPKNKEHTKMIILYLHGGSYVGALNNEHWDFLSDIIDDTGATIVVPDYPLTPKYNYEDVFNMVEPIYINILKNKKDNKFILMGDSAGGGLGLALVQKLGEENIEMPNKTILLSPWLDVRLQNPEIQKIEPNDPILSKVALKVAGEHYAGKDGRNSYLVNPIDGPLKNLRNVIIFTGTYDILNADTKILLKRASLENVKIDIKEYEKAVHIWMLNRYTKKNSYKAEEAYQDIITLLKSN